MTARYPRKSRRPSFLITAGPTRERIDPVRYISNYSTGTFGYEIARAAHKRGYRTTLISGPTFLTPPANVKFISIESAEDMCRAVIREYKHHDCLIMSAAVADWRVERPALKKIKKGARLQLRLVQNVDILKKVGEHKKGAIVGFALETESLEKNAVKKMLAKNMDLVVANVLGRRRSPFGEGRMTITILDKYGNKTTYRKIEKAFLADIILDKALAFTI